jgi:hypothetical protein
VDELPAGLPAQSSGSVDRAACVVLESTVDAVTGAADDTAEFLDVDVDELAGPRALVAPRRLEPDPAQATETAAAGHRRNGRERHRQRLGDLAGRHPQPPQRDDHLFPLCRGAVSDAPGGR